MLILLTVDPMGPFVTSEPDLGHYLPRQQKRNLEYGGETCHVYADLSG
jgi:hypothetical protein